MIDGGQQITSIDHHLQNGGGLFESDPKGALAAYYQAVSLEPTHIEGWNQIGRLMFDMQQYSEAEMVFKRVEQLATQQGLPDWAEMATQNIELTRQTLAENAVSDQAEPVVVEQEVVQETHEATAPQIEIAEPISPALADIASEETQSIADISNIAAVAQLPEVEETVLLQPEAVQEIVGEPTSSAVSVKIPTVEVMEAPIVATPIRKASAQTIEVVEEPIPVPAPFIPVATQDTTFVAPAAIDPVASDLASLIPSDTFAPVSDPQLLPPEAGNQPMIPVQPNPSNNFGQPAPAMPPVPPAAQIPVGEHLQAGSPFPNMPMPAQPVLQGGQSSLPQMPPPTPFPAQPAPVMAAPVATSLAMNNPPSQPPSMVPPTADVAMEEPKSSTGKIALMITGVVGALGIGIGAAQYLNTSGDPTNSVPVIKSEVKLEPKPVITTVILPDLGQPEEMAAPEVVAPQNADRNRAYKIGMTHLVKGEFAEARPYLEQAVAKGHAEAAFNLASLYAKGDGVEQSYETAVSYLQKSTDGGFYPGMTNLGLLYAKGQGVEQNYLTARSLWLKAAAGEHPDAMHNLAVIYATGKGVDKDLGEAIKWYRKGANAGYVDSIFDLGLLYANGDGVDRDYTKAKRLWETASGKGHKLAARNLEKLNKVMAQ